ncbi:MAG: Autotransporter translocation and assembly factor TamB [Gemmatimonadetes bacterium]|nr:Autotransporter translocation and assembly factor TamB [Gemmatimonadota bacterium]
MVKHRRYRAQRAAMLLVGLLVGFAITLGAVYLYLQHVRHRQYEAAVSAQLGLPREFFTLEEVREDGTVSATLRQVALLDRSGDTVATAPTVALRLDAKSLSRDGPIVFPSMELRRPVFRLVQLADGTWNAARIFRVEAGGKPVQPPASGASTRPYLVRDLRIVDGRATIATPAAPKPAKASFASARGPDQTRWKGRTYDVRRVTGMQAVLPRVLVGPAGALRVDVGSFRADVTSPDVAVRQLAGWLETKNGTDYRFAVTALRTDRSAFDGDGGFTLASAGMTYDVRVRAHPLDLRDLAGLGFKVPSSGTARFALAARSLAGGRTRVAVTEAAVDLLGSHASGRLTALLAPNRPAVFTDTRLTLDPLRISTIEELGLTAKPTGFSGEIRGTVASVDEVRGGSGALRLDLSAGVAPSHMPGAEPSLLAATGDVLIGGKEPFRLDRVRVEARPLLLSTFAKLLPAQAALLQGAVRGTVLLSGTPAALRVDEGDLSYVVGNAAPTRLSGLTGRIAVSPTLSYDLRARAAPLALATLTQLFPSLPFRSATLTGPISLAGSAERVALKANLSGTAGGIDLDATMALGGPVPRFDLTARLDAFRTGDVLAAESAPSVPLSGTVAATGTTEDFHFDVNLLQGGGSLALHGGVRRPAGGDLQFDVAGRAEQFRIGALVGRPNLLAGPVTGPIAIAGGGRQPLRFNVDLQGPLGLLDLHGWYQQATVPSYSVRGNVVGLDLSGLPGTMAFPSSRITGTLELDGRGITPETFAGTLGFDIAAGSTLGGVPIDAATGHVTGGGGQLRVDTLVLALRGARAEASGVLGLSVPSAQGLAFSVRAPDLALLAGLFAGTGAEIPRVEGSLSASGRVLGTLSAPRIVAKGSGANLRYGDNRAATFALDVDLARAGAGWTGRAAVDGTNVVAAGQSLATLHLNVDAAADHARFGLSARRDADTDVVAAGTLQMADGAPTGALLDTLAVRLGGATWSLVRPARVAYTADAGLAVQNLRLERTGGQPGFIEAQGTLPPTGTANLTVSAGGIDLAEARRLLPTLPAVGGTFALNATVRGPVDRPVLDVRGTVVGLGFGSAKADTVTLSAQTDATGMHVGALARVNGRTLFTADGRLPVTLSLGGIVPGVDVNRDGPVDVRVAADSLPVDLVAGAFPGFSGPAGIIRGSVDVKGTLNSPAVAGGATLTGGALTVDAVGVRYSGVNGSVRLAGKVVTVDSVVAHTGAGFLRLSGTADLTDGQHPELDLTAVMRDFQVIDKRRVAKLSATTTASPLRLSGRFPSATVSGDLLLDDGTIYIPATRTARAIDVVDIDVGELGADTVQAPVGAGAALLAQLNAQNLHVAVGDNVWLESPDARIQLGGDLDITRSGGATRVTGDLEARRGTYTFRYGPVARDFAIERGRVRFFGTPELNPSLDIVASHVVRPLDAASNPVTVYITVGGTLNNPSIALSSDTRPPLSEPELLSLIVFGRRTNELGALPEQLAQGLLFQEALGGLFSSFESAIARTGIFDYVRISTQSSFTGTSDPLQLGRGLIGTPTLELGKQLSDRLFLTLEVANVFSTSATSAQTIGIALDAQITAATSLRAAYEPVRRDPLLQSLGRIDYQFSVDVRRRWEYGRPRNRAPVPAPTPGDTLRAASTPGGSATPAPQAPPPPPPSTSQAPPPAAAPKAPKADATKATAKQASK